MSKKRSTGVVTAVPKESDAQAQYFDWIKLIPVPGTNNKLYDFTYAVPNGAMLAGTAEQRARYMNFLRRRGLKPGVSDIVIALPKGQYHGAYLEAKRDKTSKVDADQVAWRDLMRSVGYYAEICVGFAGLQEHTMNYLKPKKS